MAQDQFGDLYFPLNLPDGTVQGPFSFRGENVNLRCRNSLMILGTLHHQGSMRGFRMYLKVKINVRGQDKRLFYLGSFLGKGA